MFVTLLEARNRPGGRIHTISVGRGKIPVELGAEFVHGKRNESWKFIKAANLETYEVPDRHWIAKEGTLREDKEFWDEMDSVVEKIDSSASDVDFASFLASISAEDRAKWLTREYVEGFHAAPVSGMSSIAFAKSEEAAEKADGTRQFRLRQGYSSLIESLLREIKHVPISYDTNVVNIRWEPGFVEVNTLTNSGPRRFEANKCLITVPLGVLREAIDFSPALIEKEKAIHSLQAGQVTKLMLQFHSRFWPVENFGFIHSADKWLPTWWSDERGPLLTGWAGGTRAQTLNQESKEVLVAEALRALSAIFQIPRDELRNLLVTTCFHNWSSDPFARGAYSFTPAGMISMCECLREPVADTLFFAGEATDSRGSQGTVHGAIASGEREAKAILRIS